MREGPPPEQPPDYPSLVKRQQEILKGMYGQVGENLPGNLHHQRDVYNARCKGNAKPYQVGDLVWLEGKPFPRWVHEKFYRPWSGPWQVVKVKSDVTYRIRCKEATPTRRRRKLYLSRPSHLQLALDDVERDTGQPTDLNVGGHDVLELPWARAADALPGGPAPTENAAAVNREPDLQLRRSTRDHVSLPR